MKHFFVVAVEDGFAVAHWDQRGMLSAVEESYTREGAEAGAARWNLRREAEMARAALSAARYREHGMQPRRPVRWFEPDAFA